MTDLPLLISSLEEDDHGLVELRVETRASSREDRQEIVTLEAAAGSRAADHLVDDFSGSDALLAESIRALLFFDAKGALVPHGVGGHARKLLAAAAARLATRAA